MSQAHPPRPPLTIRMHAADNVAIVANDGGLPAGSRLPEGVPGAGLRLLDKVPQGHKVSLEDIAQTLRLGLSAVKMRLARGREELLRHVRQMRTEEGVSS